MKLLFYFVATYFIIVFFFYLFQRQLIYFPEQDAPTPAEAGVPEMQIVQLQTPDGLLLNAWYSQAQTALPTIVYFHGNAGHIGYRAQIIYPFLKAGYGVLLVTYRGYSGNPGKPSEEGFYQDARAALKFLLEQNISSKSIVAYGESIGCGVAVQMGVEYPLGALVLQSPFTSLGAVGQFHYPFLPVKWLIKDDFNILEKAKKIQEPVLILHGSQDNIVPAQFSQQLFEALAEPKQIEIIPNAGHNDLQEPAMVFKFINKWVKKDI